MAPSAASKIDYSDGAAGSPSPTGGAGGGGGFNIEPSKKKRGRPRKYSPDAAGSNIALGLSPTSITPISSGGIGLADSAGGGALSSETPIKKHRGRPPGSGKRQLDALGHYRFSFNFSFSFFMLILVDRVEIFCCLLHLSYNLQVEGLGFGLNCFSWQGQLELGLLHM